MQQKMARPTPIEKSLYVKFTNKCRTNGREINVVLSELMLLYSKDGEKIFGG